MRFYVGTSGWMYDWNPDGFKWFAERGGLNAVELNASFYRYPFPSQVVGWAKVTRRAGLRWAVKANRLFTHVYLMSEKAVSRWPKFRALFKPLEEFIDFYLFQLPPRAKPTEVMVKRIAAFAEEVNLGWKLAIEWRSSEWFKRDWVEWARDHELTVVSVDSPEFIFYARSGPYTYVRMHGRTFWYAHYYTDEELREVAEEVIKLGGEAAYVFFNNNHDMLENARRMLKVLQGTAAATA